MKKRFILLTTILLLILALSSCITQETIQGKDPIQSGDQQGNNNSVTDGDLGDNQGENSENGVDDNTGDNNNNNSDDNDNDNDKNDNDGNELPSHEHSASEWIIDKEPTCTETGSKHKECTECLEILETSPIDAEGHDPINDDSENTCSKCGKKASQGLEFRENDDGTYTVIGIGSYLETDLVIPSHNNGMPVIAIENCAFENNSNIKSVEIPNTVTRIGEYAFKECHNINFVSFGKGVKKIQNSAFMNCTGLVEVNIPANITVLEGHYGYSGIFEGCTGLKKVTIGNSSFFAKNIEIGQYIFKNCLSLESVYIGNNVGSIGSAAFEGCVSLNSLNIGESVKEIGDFAFYDCNSLTRLHIPASVETIKYSAFQLCTSLNSVEFEYGLKEIGNSAFANCTSLTELYLPSSVTVTDGNYGYSGTFEGCTSLKKVIIGDNTVTNPLLDLAMSMFKDCTSLEEVYIGNNVGSIGSAAFNGCVSLNSLNIGESVKEIGDFAFYDCNSLTRLHIPASVETIKYSAFQLCTSLNSVEFEYGLKEIGNSAFANCTSLTEIYLPSSVTVTDGNYGYSGTFEGCTSLKKATIGDNTVTNPLLELAMSMFKDCTSLEEVYIGSNVGAIGAATFEGCSSLNKLSIGESVKLIGNHAFYECTSLANVQIPASVEKIEESAFRLCSSLNSVEFENGLKEIGNSAFAYCTSLTEVYLPSSVTVTDGNYGYSGTFEGCTNLKKAIIGDNTVTNQSLELARSMFKDCTSLEEVYIGSNVFSIGQSSFEGCSALSKVTIVNSVDSICYRAFMDCSSLISLTIPGSVTNIDEGAFYNCTSLSSVTIEHSDEVKIRSFNGKTFENCPNMTRIFYTGTDKDWKSIIIDSDSLYPLNLSPYYYSATEPNTIGDFWYYNSRGEERIWNVDESSFNAAYASHNFVQIFGKESTSYSNLLLDELLADKTFQSTLIAWESAHIIADFTISEDPLNQISEKDLYKLAIYDLLCGEVNSQRTLADFLTSTSASYATSMIKDIFGNEEMAEYIMNLPCDISYSPNNLTIDVTIYEIFLNSSKNMAEAIKKYSMYETLSGMNEYFKDVLIEISNDYSNSESLRNAAAECANLFSVSIYDLQRMLANDLLSSVPDAIMEAFLNKLWDALATEVVPAIGAIQITAKGLLFLANAGFNIDNTIQAYYKLYVAVHLENALRTLIHDTYPDYMRLSSQDQAERYLYKIELYRTSVLLGFDYSSCVISESMKTINLTNSTKEKYLQLIDRIEGYKSEKKDLYARFDELSARSYLAYYF